MGQFIYETKLTFTNLTINGNEEVVLMNPHSELVNCIKAITADIDAILVKIYE